LLSVLFSVVVVPFSKAGHLQGTRVLKLGNQRGVHFFHKGITHFLVQGLGEALVGISLDTQVPLDGLQLLQALVPVVVQLSRYRANLTDLKLETLILSLLALLRLQDDVVENGDFFSQVTLDVVALGLRDRLDRVLLALQLAHLLAGEAHISLQLDDLLL